MFLPAWTVKVFEVERHEICPVELLLGQGSLLIFWKRDGSAGKRFDSGHGIIIPYGTGLCQMVFGTTVKDRSSDDDY